MGCRRDLVSAPARRMSNPRETGPFESSGGSRLKKHRRARRQHAHASDPPSPSTVRQLGPRRRLRDLKSTLKRIVGPQWQLRIHRLSRLRWLTKYRLVRSSETSLGPRSRISYVLLDPETESFSFELADERALISGLAAAYQRPESELLRFAEEPRHDPELNELLRRHVRWMFDVRNRLPLGHRLAWYVMARALAPALIVETGIYNGLGSLVLLRALARNRDEGQAGQLFSFDLNPNAGRVVRPEAREGWTVFTGLTHDLLLPALAGHEVGLFIQDTPHTEENQRFEFEAALQHRGSSITLVDGSGGWASTLARLCEEQAGRYHRLEARSRNHVHAGADLTFGVFPGEPGQAEARRAREDSNL